MRAVVKTRLNRQVSFLPGRKQQREVTREFHVSFLSTFDVDESSHFRSHLLVRVIKTRGEGVRLDVFRYLSSTTAETAFRLPLPFR